MLTSCLLGLFLLAIDDQSIQRLLISFDLTKEEHDWMDDKSACRAIKGRDASRRDHLRVRIETEDIHLV